MKSRDSSGLPIRTSGEIDQKLAIRYRRIREEQSGRFPALTFPITNPATSKRTKASNPPLSARTHCKPFKISNMICIQGVAVVGTPDKSVQIVHILNCFQPMKVENPTIRQRLG